MKSKNIRETVYGQVKVCEPSYGNWCVEDLKGNVIVPVGKYGWIDGFDNGLARVRTKGDLGARSKWEVVKIFDDDAEDAAEKEVSQPAKWGIINEKGEEVLPCEYDDVWNFLGKNRTTTKVVKGGQEFTFDLSSQKLVPSIQKRNITNNRSMNYEDDRYFEEERPRYGKYSGTYAQDVEGWSDEMIDDALDGEADAYWNID